MFRWPIPIPVSPLTTWSLLQSQVSFTGISLCERFCFYLACISWLQISAVIMTDGISVSARFSVLRRCSPDSAPGQSRAGVPGSSVQHSYSLQVSQSSGRTVISPPPQSLLETQTANISLPRLISDCDPGASVHVSWWDDESDRKLLSVRSIRLPRDCSPR